MNKHTVKPCKGQGSRHQAEVLAELCYRFVRPLLQRLHAQMDRRLVHTFLDLLPVIVMHRHRNQGLLLSELGGFLLGAEHAPAGTKRISNLLRSLAGAGYKFERNAFHHDVDRASQRCALEGPHELHLAARGAAVDVERIAVLALLDGRFQQPVSARADVPDAVAVEIALIWVRPQWAVVEWIGEPVRIAVRGPDKHKLLDARRARPTVGAHSARSVTQLAFAGVPSTARRHRGAIVVGAAGDRRRTNVLNASPSTEECFVAGTADATMDRLNAVARLLRRKHRFGGYIHLKVIPGSSNAAIEEAVSLASAVSLNIETPGAECLKRLSHKKDFIRDIVEPIKLISRLTSRGSRYEKVKQTTQFIVGAAGERDVGIIKYMSGLYERLNMQRVYFSAYQKGLGDESIAGERAGTGQSADVLMREHRLYQVDFLFRRYGFAESDIIFEEDGNLSLAADPKEIWAQGHPEYFPVNANEASRLSLLRVPGLGPVTVKRILQRRKQARIKSIEDVGKPGVRLAKANQYLSF